MVTMQQLWSGYGMLGLLSAALCVWLAASIALVLAGICYRLFWVSPPPAAVCEPTTRAGAA